MKLFQYIEKHQRSYLYTTYQSETLLSHTGDVKIGYVSFKEHDYTPLQEATIPKLLLIVQGEGWVLGANNKKVRIKAGEAAFWRAGEYYEIGSATGMTAFSIEGLDIKPEKWLMPVADSTSL
ncbi:cupin [Priestia megaterium]|nr:cupin [Priestia megaterium]